MIVNSRKAVVQFEYDHCDMVVLKKRVVVPGAPSANSTVRSIQLD